MKHGFFALCCAALLLCACGAPLIPVEEDARVFSGTVQNYPAGEASLVAVALADEGEVVFGGGSIDPSGSFDFELPERLEVGLEPIGETFCEGLSFSDDTAQTAYVFSIDVLEDGIFIGSLYQATSEGVATGFLLEDGEIVVRRIYADRNVTVTGTCDFSPDTYSLALREGWNIVVEVFREVEPAAFRIDGTTGAVPAGAGWFFVAE